MNNLQKLVILTLFTASNRNTDPQLKGAIADLMENPDMGKAIFNLKATGEIEETGVLSKKGRAIAHKLSSIGMNYKESATKGSFGNAQAMLSGSWDGFKSHVETGTLYTGSSAYKAIDNIVREGTELLKKATDEAVV